MKPRELREKSKEELNSLVNEFSVKLGQLRFSNISTKLKNPSEINELKKDIARIKTIIKEKN